MLAPAPWPELGAGGQAAAPELLEAVRSTVLEERLGWVDSAACGGVLSLEGCRVKGGEEERAGLGTLGGELVWRHMVCHMATAKRASLVAQLVKTACNAGDPGSVPGLGRSPGEGNCYPLQYSWASLVAQLVKNLPAMQETWV